MSFGHTVGRNLLALWHRSLPEIVALVPLFSKIGVFVLQAQWRLRVIK